MIDIEETRTVGIRKAAIFVASLDRAAADLLLDQLSPERARLVRQALMAIDAIDVEERQRVVDEFRRIELLVPPQYPAGVELDGPMSWKPASPLWTEIIESAAEQAAGQTFLSARQGVLSSSAHEGSEAAGPFGFLHRAEEEKLAQLLTTEGPQAIALVLSHLPPQRAGAVLARFAAPLQAEVVRRLVELQNADLETLRDVEQALEARLLRLFTERREAPGPETIKKIFDCCDGQTIGAILDNLATYDEPLAQKLGRRPLGFDDLGQFDDATLLAVFRAADPAVAQIALLGATPELAERIFRRMVPREANILRRKLKHPGPIRLSDIEEAQRQIAELADRLSRDNRVTLQAA